MGKTKATPEQEVESLGHEQERQIHAVPSSLLSDLQAEVSSFQGGRLKQFSENWLKITFDPEILKSVTGLQLEFDCPVSQLHCDTPCTNKAE